MKFPAGFAQACEITAVGCECGDKLPAQAGPGYCSSNSGGTIVRLDFLP